MSLTERIHGLAPLHARAVVTARAGFAGDSADTERDAVAKTIVCLAQSLPFEEAKELVREHLRAREEHAFLNGKDAAQRAISTLFGALGGLA